MAHPLEDIMQTAVAQWVLANLGIDEVICYLFPDELEADRNIAVFAARGQTEWQALEVWVEDGIVVSINSLGEGVPPDDAVWPWD